MLIVEGGGVDKLAANRISDCWDLASVQASAACPVKPTGFQPPTRRLMSEGYDICKLYVPFLG